MQIKIAREEIFRRDLKSEVLSKPEGVYSTFINGYLGMLARIKG